MKGRGLAQSEQELLERIQGLEEELRRALSKDKEHRDRLHERWAQSPAPALPPAGPPPPPSESPLFQTTLGRHSHRPHQQLSGFRPAPGARHRALALVAWALEGVRALDRLA